MSSWLRRRSRRRGRCRGGRRGGHGRGRRRGRARHAGARRRWPRAGGRGWSPPLPPARAMRSSPSGAKSAAATRIVGSSLVRDASTIVAIAAASPTTSRWISCSGRVRAWGHRRGSADTSLTPALTPPYTSRACSRSRCSGPVEVRRDGRLVPVPGGKTSELLVRLALEAGPSCARTASSTTCGRGAVHTRRNTLQSKVTRLRRALGDPSVIASGDGGYRLAVDPYARRRARACSRAAVAAPRARRRRRPRRRRPERVDAGAVPRARSCRRGDGEWVDAAPGAARRGARCKLVETQLSARLRLGDARRDRRAGGRGRHLPVPGRPVGAADHRPLPSGPPGRRARDLPAGARAARRRARPRARAAAAAARAADPATTTPRASRRARARPGNLPSMSAELVGREAEIAAVLDLLDRRLVEIVGPGGIGKTAVAIATGRVLETPGGVWLARLEAATTADEVARRDDRRARRRRRRGGAARAAPDRPAVGDPRQLRARRRRRRGAGARLLDAAPGCGSCAPARCRSTSTARSVYELAPLGLSDAIELFTRRPPRKDPARRRDDGGAPSSADRSTVCPWRSSSRRPERDAAD